MSLEAQLSVHEMQMVAARSVRRRIILLAVSLLLLFAVVGARLFDLQVVQHSRYSTLARENHIRVKPLPPPRGLVYSADNVLLAGNLPSYDLVLRQEYLDVDSRQFVTDSLHEIIPELDLDAAIAGHRQRGLPVYEPVPLWSGLDDRQRDRILVKLHRLPGLDIVTSSRRFYPLAAAGMHLLGYVSGVTEVELDDPERGAALRIIGNIGRTGVERSFENWLRGISGAANVEVDASGRVLGVVSSSKPQPGKDLHISVDASLQLDAYHALNGRRGAVVAIEAASGLVRALVSSPAANPDFFITGYRPQTDSAGRRQGNMFNRALAGQYPPGSTIKPFFALAGLYHDAEVTRTGLWCNGMFTLANNSHRYNDWKAHGEINTHSSIASSCDVFYYRLALELGVQRSGAFLRQFGFGKLTGIELPGEKAGLVPDDAWKKSHVGERWYPGDSVSYGIGQGYLLVTPIQLAVATARLFSGNSWLQPALIENVEAVVAPTALQLDINQQHLQLVQDGMRAVVHGHNGTARAQAERIDFEVAGKTGTAQVVRLRPRAEDEPIPEFEQDHSLFIVYGPLPGDTQPVPPLALVVIVENAGSGSKVAAPIAVDIISAYVRRAMVKADGGSR